MVTGFFNPLCWAYTALPGRTRGDRHQDDANGHGREAGCESCICSAMMRAGMQRHPCAGCAKGLVLMPSRARSRLSAFRRSENMDRGCLTCSPGAPDALHGALHGCVPGHGQLEHDGRGPRGTDAAQALARARPRRRLSQRCCCLLCMTQRWSAPAAHIVAQRGGCMYSLSMT